MKLRIDAHRRPGRADAAGRKACDPHAACVFTKAHADTVLIACSYGHAYLLLLSFRHFVDVSTSTVDVPFCLLMHCNSGGKSIFYPSYLDRIFSPFCASADLIYLGLHVQDVVDFTVCFPSFGWNTLPLICGVSGKFFYILIFFEQLLKWINL